MRIGINLLYLIPNIVGGTEIYASGLLHGLSNIDKENQYIIFLNRESAEWELPDAKNFTRIICPIEAKIRLQRYLYEQFRLPIAIKKFNLDVLHSLGYVGPLFVGCPSVVTIPDLNYIALKQYMPFYKNLVLRTISRLSAKNADKVITISNFSKSQIIDKLKIPEDKVFVTPLAPQPRINQKHINPDAIGNIYHLKYPYIVAFGGGSAHKNICQLIRAFAIISNEYIHNLVLIGHIHPEVNSLINSLSSDIQQRIIITGYVQSEHIIPLIRDAQVFVLPSLYEGFGIPLLEAQQAGVAVACSSAASLPEVGGEGALYFDPNITSILVEIIIKLLEDENMRKRIVIKGFENLKRFSWDKTAELTLVAYRSIW